MNIELITTYKFNLVTLQRNLDGISQEDSLITPSNGGACINWILGHIMISRNDILELLNQTKIIPEHYEKYYARETNNRVILNPENISVILDLINKTQDIIMNELENKNDLTEKQRKDIAFFGFHESYHCGQIGLLRRVVGKPGAI
ncbi:MAG TPA: hypothetical protein PLG90_04260 [Ignavibacteria bacterium]|nr:hypothetical protein [Ignavibacteria bacterium]